MDFIATIGFTKNMCLKSRLNTKTFTLFVLCILSAPSSSGLESHSISYLVNLMEESLAENKNLPKVSLLSDSLSLEDAYLIQRKFVARQGAGKISGYKGAFFDLSSRKKFNFAEPISGILKSGCVFTDGEVIKLENYPGLRLELELGFRLKQGIQLSSKNINDLSTEWFELVPVVEMPQILFSSIKDIKAVDLIAGNVAASCWLEGAPLFVSDFTELDQMEVKMFVNEKMIEQVYGDYVGGQKDALTWLIKHLLSRKVRLKKGDLLITGKLGKIHNPYLGHYSVEYGSLSELTFLVVE